MAVEEKKVTYKIIRIPAGGLDPDKQPEIVEMDRLELSDMQKLVGGYIEHMTLDRQIDLWFNEEGRLTGLPPNRLFTRFDGMEFDILGDAFITSSNEEGETISLTDEQARVWLAKVKELPVGVMV